ncbi:protein GVQW3-like [Nomia melanderi]|uniref:protein GVQW3-like n=1 Tax=Nomia melanderi TaxID=2448451 RepID=UPI003FCED5A6
MRTSVSEQQTKKQVQVGEEKKKMEKLEHRAVIKFLTIEGLTPNQIKERMDNVYSDSASSYSLIKNWSKLFRWGRESIEDDPRSSRPVNEAIPENVKLVEEIVLSNRRLKTKEIAKRATLSKTTVLRILHDHLGMSKISARCVKWISKVLSSQ